jgi:hypothetical protein
MDFPAKTAPITAIAVASSGICRFNLLVLDIAISFIIRRNSSVYGGTKHERLLLHHGRDRHGFVGIEQTLP